MTNSTLLRLKIKNKGFRLSHLVCKLNTSYAWLKKKIDGEIPFKNDEILILSKILELTDSEIMDIFFADEVDKMTTKNQ